VSSETTGPREIDRALFALDSLAAPRYLVCAPVHTYAYPAFPDEVWLCDPGGQTIEATRACAAQASGGEWVLIVERIDVKGEDWPASDRPCVTDYHLREGSWLVLVPSARLAPSWVAPRACLVARVTYAGEDELAARDALASESARALLGRVHTLESVEAGLVVRWLKKTATCFGGGWN
jgi:hypothetical protein